MIAPLLLVAGESAIEGARSIGSARQRRHTDPRPNNGSTRTLGSLSYPAFREAAPPSRRLAQDDRKLCRERERERRRGEGVELMRSLLTFRLGRGADQQQACGLPTGLLSKEKVLLTVFRHVPTGTTSVLVVQMAFESIERAIKGVAVSKMIDDLGA